jgi:prolipoprotein diacylglyceryltransferase
MLQVLWRIPIKLNDTFPDGIPIYGFGMMLFLAFLLCTWLASRRARQEGIAPETIQDLAIWIFLGGLLGARITYLAQETPRPDLVEMLKRLPKIWDGGIILYGAVLGGLAAYAVAYFLIYRKRGLSTLKLADVIAPSVAIGLCLGRLGCFLNGCCYGQVACPDCAVVAVSFPLAAPAREALVAAGDQTPAGFTLAELQPPALEGIGVKVGQVDPGSRAYASGLRPGDVITEVNGKKLTAFAEPQGQGGKLRPIEALAYVFRHWPRGRFELALKVLPGGNGEPETRTFIPWTLGLYPTQLYEVVSMLLLFLVLTAYYPLRHHPGQVMAVLMMGYAVHRYLNEILRDDPRPIGFERYTSVVLFVAGLLMWLALVRRAAPPEEAPPASAGGGPATATTAS